MTPAKPWYLSVGVWGALVSLTGSALALVKVRLDPALLEGVRDWLLALATLVGATASLYGRVRASRRIGFASPGAGVAKQNWRMNAALPALLLLPALSAWGLGCGALGPSLASPSAAYVASDRATYDAVAPEYSAYVHADPSLDDDAKVRRERTLETWRVRLGAGERPKPEIRSTGYEAPNPKHEIRSTKSETSTNDQAEND